MGILTGERAIGRAAARHGDPIRVTALRDGYFPQTFVWRGRRHAVVAVERCWTLAGRHWPGRPARIARHCFRVRCAEGTFDLVQELASNSWTLQTRGRQS
jgi:hypothetical protein